MIADYNNKDLKRQDTKHKNVNTNKYIKNKVNEISLSRKDYKTKI